MSQLLFPENGLRLVVLFCGALSCSFLLEPLAIAWAHRFGIVDRPNRRKTHARPVASAGGLVFLPTLALCLTAVFFAWPALWHEKYLGLVLAGSVVTAAGLWDDMFGMRAPVKLGCQLLAGTVLFAFGYRIQNVTLLLSQRIMDLGPLDLVLTVLAVAAIINAINMLDGLDGLAGGSVCIMAAFLLYSKLSHGGAASSVILVVTIGATAGFLLYNFHPARVFMGDTGSMFLGLLIAGEFLDSVSYGTAVTTLLLPLAVLAVPLFDMLYTIIKRAAMQRSVLRADRNHIHHRLLDLGLSHRAAVFVVYAMNVQMGIMAALYEHVRPEYRGLYLLSMASFLFIVFYTVGTGRTSGTIQERVDTLESVQTECSRRGASGERLMCRRSNCRMRVSQRALRSEEGEQA